MRCQVNSILYFPYRTVLVRYGNTKLSEFTIFTKLIIIQKNVRTYIHRPFLNTSNVLLVF